MNARSKISQVLVAVAPLLLVAACGDDVSPSGVGGQGGAGGSTTGTSVSTGPSSTSSTSTSTSTSTSSTSTSSDGGGGQTTTSSGGGFGGSADGGGGFGGSPDGGGGFGGSPDGGGGFGGSPDGGGGFGGSPDGGGGFGGSPVGGGGFGGSPVGTGGAGGTTGIGGSGGGGVIVQPGGLATCPGDSYIMEPGSSYQLQGTTNGAGSDYASCFGATGGNDTVFSFTLTEAGTFRLRLVDSPVFNANLVLRSTCDSATGEQCIPSNSYGDSKGIARHFNPGTYYVIVDALAGASGQFDLFASFDLPTCGDAIVNPGEECDVGAAVPGDGCGNPGAGNECQITAPAVGTDQCPGEALDVPAGSSSILADSGYSTIGYADDARGSCFFASGGADRVFTLDPAVSGSLTVTVGRTDNDGDWACQADNTSPDCWDQFLYARTDCASTDINDELDCADDYGTSRGEQITFDVIAGEPVYLFVDGFNGAAYSRGPFNLFFELTP